MIMLTDWVILVDEHAREAYVCAEATELISTLCVPHFLDAFPEARATAVAFEAGYRPVHGCLTVLITMTLDQL
jgi:hypothetical protein